MEHAVISPGQSSFWPSVTQGSCDTVTSCVYISSTVYWNRFMLLPLKKYILTTQDSTRKYYFWSPTGGVFRYDSQAYFLYIYNAAAIATAL